MAEEVTSFIIPADPKYAQSLRLLAGGLAHTADLSFDEVEDAKMIAAEAFVYALSTEQDSVVINFTIDEGTFQMTFSLGKARKDASKETFSVAGQDFTTPEFARVVMDSLTDSFSVDANNNALTLVKRAKDASATYAQDDDDVVDDSSANFSD